MRELDAKVAEKWAPLPNFPDYDISDIGRVRSAQGRVLATRVGDRGYVTVSLWADGYSVLRLVHRMMLEAFVGPAPSEKHHACHIDGAKTNNVLSNLRWATPKENIADKWRHGTMPVGEKTNSVKLTNEQVQDVRMLYRSGIKSPELAKRFRVHKTTICRILRGETWRHI